MQPLYRESDEAMREAFIEKVRAIPSESLVYVDVTGIDKHLYREYARALRGKKVAVKISGRKYKRTNIVAGICQGEWISSLQYNGTTDSILFEYPLQHCLLKEIKNKHPPAKPVVFQMRAKPYDTGYALRRTQRTPAARDYYWPPLKGQPLLATP